MEALLLGVCYVFFSSRRRHTRCSRDWSSECALPIYRARVTARPSRAPGGPAPTRASPQTPDRNVVDRWGIEAWHSPENRVLSRSCVTPDGVAPPRSEESSEGKGVGGGGSRVGGAGSR